MSTAQVILHLTFNGECEAAFKLYEQCLGGKITFLGKYGEATKPPPSPELVDKVIHATLKVGDQTLTGLDVANADYRPPQGFSVQLNVAGPEEAERIFQTLAESGKVVMPLQKTFWSPAFGVLTDRFGTPWEINCAS
jgi:PhnB protein